MRLIISAIADINQKAYIVTTNLLKPLE